MDNNINIKATNHASDNNLNKPKLKTEQVTHLDVIDPTKVIKPAKGDPSNQTGKNPLNYNPNSVFDKFIKSLQDSPGLSESANKLLLNRQFVNRNIKGDSVLNSLFESFLTSIEMNDTEILNFLKFQQESYTKFNGDFFNSLRNLLKSNYNNKDFKIILRNFLRSYDCFVSVDDTYKSINAALKNIENSMPDILKKPLNELISKLITDHSANADEINLNVLKNDILPFVGRYISKMNDFGPVKNYVSVLIHNIVRLESASKENFSDDLDNLFEFIKYNFNLDDKSMEKLKLSLIDTYENSSNIKNNSIDTFLKLIESGIHNSDNAVNKGVMEDMTDSLLFSQNVHIPLTHMFMPLNYNGMFMFSEIWIGKEYEDYNTNKKDKQNPSETYKAFITFDIQNIGYFETTFVLRESKLSLEIFVPGNLNNYIESIKNDLSKILNKNSLSVNEFNVYEIVKKRKFNDVFHNITERKSSVDVTV